MQQERSVQAGAGPGFAVSTKALHKTIVTLSWAGFQAGTEFLTIYSPSTRHRKYYQVARNDIANLILKMVKITTKHIQVVFLSCMHSQNYDPITIFGFWSLEGLHPVVGTGPVCSGGYLVPEGTGVPAWKAHASVHGALGPVTTAFNEIITWL